jgi:glycerol-3-phosphate dehydrogenase
MDDARLVIENLIDATAGGAEVKNYFKYLGAERNSQGLWEVHGEERFSGNEQVVEARRIAFATGAWTDGVSPMPKKGSPMVRMTQGSHLIVKGIHARHPMILPVPNSRRYFFVIPFAEGQQNGLHLVGTTELELPPGANPDVEATDAECVELMGLLALYFPGDRPEMICAFAGVRPLARGQGATASLSREHAFHAVGENAYAAVGGKYTTYRLLASEFLAKLIGEKPDLSPVKERPLPGSFSSPQQRNELEGRLSGMGLLPEVVRRWLALYGCRAEKVAEYLTKVTEGKTGNRTSPIIERNPENAPPHTSFEAKASGRDPSILSDWMEAELAHSFAHEYVKTPVDFLRRRSGLFFAPHAGLAWHNRLEVLCKNSSPNLASTLGLEADYFHLLQRSRHVAG